jgi:phytoene dehydrogenase-like protein
MESFHVKAARQSTSPITEDRGPLSPVRNGAFNRAAPFKTNYNTHTGAIEHSSSILDGRRSRKSNRHARAALITTGLSQIRRCFCLSWREQPDLIRKETNMHGEYSGSSDVDLVVVGGGLAGLSTAALVAQAGRSVLVLEQAAEVGGRATTQVREGVFFNLGPHALYFLGHAFRLMRELDVPLAGGFPNPGKSLLLREDGEAPLPFGLVSLVRSKLFSIREKARLIRFLATLPRLDSHPFDGVSVADWAQSRFGSGNAAAFVLALFRVSTYAAAADRLSAGVAIEQLKLALKGNVWYLDGGWQRLVDGLRMRAIDGGASIRTGARVKAVLGESGGVTVQLSNDEVLHSRAAVLAVAPKPARDLLNVPEDSPLGTWAASSAPIKAACLDVALNRLERPDYRFALGLDRPYYYSVHSAAAKLAPEGISVAHVMKYLRDGAASSAEEVERELEGCLDRIQPGWKSQTVVRRYLPSMTVSHGLPLASENGLAGRPAVTAAGHANVFLAGDWVGTEGLLADAAAASARSAARHVLTVLERARADVTPEVLNVSR